MLKKVLERQRPFSEHVRTTAMTRYDSPQQLVWNLYSTLFSKAVLFFRKLVLPVQ